MPRSSAPTPDNTAIANPAASSTQTLPNVDTLSADAARLAGEAQNVAGQVAAEATSTAAQIAEEAKSQLAEQTGKLKGMASEQKDLLADQVSGMAEAIDKVAAELETADNSSARYARMLADNTGKLSSTIRDNDVDALFNMAQNFGRRQPAAFLGAAALLGFVASRVMMASANRSQATSREPADVDEAAPAYGAATASTPSAYQSGRV